jgi:hypothetical protein
VTTVGVQQELLAGGEVRLIGLGALRPVGAQTERQGEGGRLREVDSAVAAYDHRGRMAVVEEDGLVPGADLGEDRGHELLVLQLPGHAPLQPLPHP